MGSAIERAREAVLNRQQEIELGKRVRTLYDDFFLWNDRQPGSSVIDVSIHEFSEVSRPCRTRFPGPIAPNERGERSRWVFTITGNSVHERVILAHYQYWEPGITEHERPSYAETYSVTNRDITPLQSMEYADRNKTAEICDEIALLIGRQKPTEPAFAPRQQGRGKQ